MLLFIWFASLALAAAAIAIMAILVCRRLWQDRRAQAEKRYRDEFRSALIRFAASGDEAGMPELIASTPNDVVTDTAFEFLALLRGEERGAVETVLAESGLPAHIRGRLAQGREAERIHATEMLVSFPGPECVESLTAALDDRSAEVRIAAAIALTKIGAQPELGVILGKIGMRGQRSRRLFDLFQSFPWAQLGEIGDYARSERAAPTVRAAALGALAQAEDFRFLPEISRAAQDAAPEVAAAAMRALAVAAHPASCGAVLDAFAHAEWQVRVEAAETAGRIGAARAIGPLIDLLEDAEWRVRFAAGRSLKALGSRGVEALREVAGSESSRAQRTASLVLSEGYGA